MIKGAALAVDVLIAVVILIFSVFLMSHINTSSSDGETTTETEEVDEGVCKTQDDCLNDPNGSICLYSYKEYFEPFCGCISNNDCIGKRSGVCGENDRCI